ncbi:MAG: DUF5723 family protein [Flavobacteriales bacterium]|nr:DUF5723 family protein [Flavobacteriales bacterium]
MRKAALLLFLAIVSVTASAQFRNPVYADWTGGYSVGIYGRAQLSTNAIGTNLQYAAFGGKFLERKARESASKRMGKVNRAGLDLDYGIFAKHLPDSAKGIGWFVNVASRTHGHGKFSKDLFDFAMFGNAQFAGKTADLSNVKVAFFTYKQYEAGILKQIKKANGTWNLGLGVSLLAGNQNLELSIDNATLYTHPDGEYLDGDFSGEIRSSSMSSGQYFDANGLGFSASLNVGYEGKKFGIAFQADDLGVLSWSQKLKHTKLDSVFRFEGVEMDLFASGGNVFSGVNLDTIVAGFATNMEGTKYSTTLPGRIQLEGFYRLNEKDLRIYAGVQYRIAPAYIPYIFVGTSSPLPKGFFIDGRFAYGGFGSWNLGLELRKRFADVVEVRAGTNNLEGFVLPMVGTSQSLYVSIAGYF